METQNTIQQPDLDLAFIHDLARDILAAHHTMLDIKHAYRPCHPRNFPHLDLDWYDNNMRLLQDLNFRNLGCLVDNMRLPGEPAPNYFNQIALSGDGSIYADLVHTTKPRRKKLNSFRETLRWERDKKFLSFHTELSNDVHIVTGTVHQESSTPGIIIYHRPQGAPTQGTLEYHIEQVEAYLAKNVGVAAVLLFDLEDVIASDQRFERKIVMVRHRRYRLTATSLIEMGYSAEIARLLLAEIMRIPALPAQ